MFQMWYNIRANQVIGQVPIVSQVNLLYIIIDLVRQYLLLGWHSAIGSFTGFFDLSAIMFRKLTKEEFVKKSSRSIFLAGGITGCPDWQQEVVKALQDTELICLNPRRANFPIDDPNAAEGQIKWEHDHLRFADEILFWFPCETLCPITLYELGAWTTSSTKPIYVGVHPKYKRRQDVEIQTSLVRPDIEIVYSLNDLVQQVRREH